MVRFGNDNFGFTFHGRSGDWDGDNDDVLYFKATTGKTMHKGDGNTGVNRNNHFEHNHKITSSNWDLETRPKNIALYLYIKVN